MGASARTGPSAPGFSTPGAALRVFFDCDPATLLQLQSAVGMLACCRARACSLSTNAPQDLSRPGASPCHPSSARSPRWSLFCSDHPSKVIGLLVGALPGRAPAVTARLRRPHEHRGVL